MGGSFDPAVDGQPSKTEITCIEREFTLIEHLVYPPPVVRDQGRYTPGLEDHLQVER